MVLLRIWALAMSTFSPDFGILYGVAAGRRACANSREDESSVAGGRKRYDQRDVGKRGQARLGHYRGIFRIVLLLRGTAGVNQCVNCVLTCVLHPLGPCAQQWDG